MGSLSLKEYQRESLDAIGRFCDAARASGRRRIRGSDLGCAKWCKFAAECLGHPPER